MTRGRIAPGELATPGTCLADGVTHDDVIHALLNPPAPPARMNEEQSGPGPHSATLIAAPGARVSSAASMLSIAVVGERFAPGVSVPASTAPVTSGGRAPPPTAVIAGSG
jgi:hypothetical protein